MTSINSTAETPLKLVDLPRVHEEESAQRGEDKTTLADVLQEHKPNPWGPGYLRLYAICGLLYLCSTMNGEHGIPVQ